MSCTRWSGVLALTSKALGVLVSAKAFDITNMRARLQYRRRLLQLRWPSLAPALTFLSLLDPRYLLARRAARRVGKDGLSQGATGLPRRESLQRLFVRNELGKI